MHNLQVIKPEALFQTSIRRATKYLEDASRSQIKDTRIGLLKLAMEAVNIAITIEDTNLTKGVKLQ